MSDEFIMQMSPLFGQEEKEALCDYMDEGGFLTEYKRTRTFERMIADYVGAKHCIVVNNGTISLTLAALASGISSGDEVIIPNYTMIATANALQFIGAKPVFVDVEPDTLCLDIENVRKAITPQTKAIVLVTANGREPSVGIEKFKEIADENRIVLIEDAAQSLGSFFENGKHIGTEGNIGSFSFSAPKIISTGQGGALVTDSDKLAHSLRRLKDFGREGGGNDVHSSIGFNFKFTELQACVGIEQMKKLPNRVTRKKEIWQRYYNRLSKSESVVPFSANIRNNVPWFVDVLVDDRAELQDYLKACGIGTRTMYPPITSQQAYGANKDTISRYPVASMVGEKGLWLPSSIQLSNDQVDTICDKILEFGNAN